MFIETITSLLVLAVSAVYLNSVSKWIQRLRRANNSVASVPCGQYTFLHPMRSLSVLAGQAYPRKGRIAQWGSRFDLYQQYGSTLLASVDFWTTNLYFWTADADIIKTVCADAQTFCKDEESLEPVNFWGANLLTANGQVWKRHRTVAQPAFNGISNKQLVWSEAVRIITEYFAVELEQQQSSRSDGKVPIDVKLIMKKAALIIISGAGFGHSVSWSSSPSDIPPNGHGLTFPSAMHSALENIYVPGMIPKWLLHLIIGLRIPVASAKLKEGLVAFSELRQWIFDFVANAKAELQYNTPEVTNTPQSDPTTMRGALLSRMVQANVDESNDSKRLSDQEVLSNSFIILVAGHETSAHSLSFALALLALYPGYQQKLYEEVMKVWPTGPDPVLADFEKDFDKLEYTLAFVRETLRLFPPATRVPKLVTVDAVLTGRRFGHSPTDDQIDTDNDKEVFSAHIPKGSIIMIDVWGVHYNPLHWGTDVAEFRPERFIDTETYKWPRDAFLAFSRGPRACIGSDFALIESVAILAMICRQYQILLPDKLKGSSRQEQERVLLGWTVGLTITPTGSIVNFRRRSKGI